ncbi:hypothetical protein MES5069_180117 [Mesorhizobium escarrei]|uniref:Uncharacterized protein n=1 Tax=Mesorhizobium escarrei TaxID=666018 RepID=A0ABM9DNV7_9HYPH|nr:hypothetical protein MES5069_180117 [Mesorhizobium escarrei]
MRVGSMAGDAGAALPYVAAARELAAARDGPSGPKVSSSAADPTASAVKGILGEAVQDIELFLPC